MNEEKLLALLVAGGTLRRTGLPMKANELSQKFKLEWKSAKRWERILSRIPMMESETYWDPEEMKAVTVNNPNVKEEMSRMHGHPILSNGSIELKSKYDRIAEKKRQEWYNSGKWKQFVFEGQHGTNRKLNPTAGMTFADKAEIIKEKDREAAKEYAKKLWGDEEETQVSAHAPETREAPVAKLETFEEYEERQPMFAAPAPKGMISIYDDEYEPEVMGPVKGKSEE